MMMVTPTGTGDPGQLCFEVCSCLPTGWFELRSQLVLEPGASKGETKGCIAYIVDETSSSARARERVRQLTPLI